MKNQILTISGLIIGIIGISLLLFIIFKLIKKTTTSTPINLLYLIFGFLVTSYIYPEGLKGIVGMFRNFFLESYAHFSSSGADTKSGIDKIIGAVFEDQLWYDSLMFVTGFIIVSFLISGVMDYFKNTAPEETTGQPFQQNIKMKNAIVSFVLVVALYFSISSIIAVPIINVQANSELKLSAELEAELNAFSKNDTILRKEYMAFIEQKKSIIPNDTNIVNNTIFKANNHFDNFEREVKLVFSEIESLKNRAIARMETTDYSNINPNLKFRDKSELSGWYLENRRNYLSHLNTKQLLINNYVTTLNNDEVSPVISVAQSFIDNNSEMLRPKTTDIPLRPTIGSDLGVFTFFTGWLLSVESAPLVIIIGLIGFGLLGAGGSTFIKEKKNNENSKVLIDDLAGVLIKGFTAAIVIFLGVQGSLAVLTTGQETPNAYALFFITFVAAVFSDDAWKWAENRFAKDLNIDKNLAVNK